MHFVNIRFFKGDIYIPVLRDFTGSVWAVFFPFFLHFSGEFAGMESCLSGLFSARRSSSSLFFLYIYILLYPLYLYPSISFFLLPIYIYIYGKISKDRRHAAVGWRGKIIGNVDRRDKFPTGAAVWRKHFLSRRSASFSFDGFRSVWNYFEVLTLDVLCAATNSLALADWSSTLSLHGPPYTFRSATALSRSIA